MPSLGKQRTEDFVFFGIGDQNGVLRGKALTGREFERLVASDGEMPLTNLVLGLDTTDTPVMTLAKLGYNAGASDLRIRPDLSTYRKLAGRSGWAVCFGVASWPDGSVCELVPRAVLASVAAKAAERGLEVRAALEYEIRMKRSSDSAFVTGGRSYDFDDTLSVMPLIEALDSGCQEMGLSVTGYHTEAAPGLLEFNLSSAEACAAADAAALLRLAVKAVARAGGYDVSFIAKHAAGEEGSSGHLHVSFWNEDGSNAFSSKVGEAVPGPMMAGAIGGLVEHLPAASALYNPTVNSYKRVVPGYFAPVNASWGLDNRSAAVRAIVDAEDRTRLELRRPGADANPYLVVAGAIASCLDGIERSLSPGEPATGDVSVDADLPALPNSLESAVRAFQADPTLQTMLGEQFSSYFLTTREWELDASRQSVTEWERDRYGEGRL